MKHFLLTLAICMSFVTAFAQNEEGHESFWINAMPQINGVDVTENDNVTLKAFYNSSCLSEATISTFTGTVNGEQISIPYFLLRVYFDVLDNVDLTGEEIEIRAYYNDNVYVFNKTYTAADGTEYGTLSNLEKLNIVVLDGYTPVMDEAIHLNIEDNDKKTVDLREHTYMVKRDASYNITDKKKLSEMDSYPGVIVYSDKKNGQSEYFTIDGYFATAKKTTSILGKEIEMDYYIQTVNGLKWKSSCYSTIAVSPYLPSLRNLELTSDAVTINVDKNETVNLLDGVKYAYYEGFNDAAHTDTIINSYTKAELASKTGYEIPEISYQIRTVDGETAHFILSENFVVSGKSPVSYKTLDTPEIVRLSVSTPTASGSSTDIRPIEVKVVPVEYQVNNLDLSTISMEKEASKNLLDVLQFEVLAGYYKIYSQTVNDVRTYYYQYQEPGQQEQEVVIDNVSELPEPTKELYDVHHYYCLLKTLTGTDESFKTPSVTWSGFDSNGTLNGSQFTATTATSIAGVPISASISERIFRGGDNANARELRDAARLYVTPFESVLKDITFNGDYLDVEKGKTADIMDYLSFAFLDSYNEQTGEETTVSYTKEELAAADIPLPENIYFSSDSTTCFTIEGSVVSGVRNTFNTGVYVYGEQRDDDNNTLLSFSFDVRVTPVMYMVKSISLPEGIEVEKGRSENLLKYITFELYGGSDPQTGDYFIEKTGADTDWLVPVVNWTGNEDDKYGTIENGVFTPEYATTDDGVTFTARVDFPIYGHLYDNVGDYPKSAETEMYITPFAIPIESIELVLVDDGDNELEGNNILVGESAKIKAKVTPSTATYDPGHLWAEVVESSNDNWHAADIDLDESGIFTYEALRAGQVHVNYYYADLYSDIEESEITINNGFEYSVASGWNWSSFFMMTEGNYSIEELDAKFGGTSEAHKIEYVLSATGVASDDPVYGYFGSLENVSENNMYKIKVNSSASYAEFESCNYDPINWDRDVYSCSIPAGWTWLAYPYQTKHSLEQIVDKGGLTFNGDTKIISLDGYVEYSDGEWTNDYFVFEPGQGYIVYTKTATSWTWPAENTIPAMSNNDQAPSKRAQSAWSYDAHAFSDVMPVVATITNMEDLDGITVGAYVDGECRGEGYVATLKGKQQLFISVHGKSGEKVTFKGYDGVDYFELDGTVKFSKMAGSTDAPVELKSALTSGINKINADVTGAVVTDMNGKVVGNDINTLPSGIYLVKDGDSVKKVVK